MPAYKQRINRSFTLGNRTVPNDKEITKGIMSKSTFKILFYTRKNQVNKEGKVNVMISLKRTERNTLVCAPFGL